MNKQITTNPLSETLRHHPDGITGIELQQISALTETDFLMAARDLWDAAELVGVTKQGCCGNRCSFACVAYMDLEYQWKLARRGS